MRRFRTRRPLANNPEDLLLQVFFIDGLDALYEHAARVGEPGFRPGENVQSRSRFNRPHVAPDVRVMDGTGRVRPRTITLDPSEYCDVSPPDPNRP